MAISTSYRCSNCGFKSAGSQGLIQGKAGCASCGKSSFKCPRCGIYMKSIRTNSPGRPANFLSENVVKAQGEFEKRSITINRI